MAIGRGWSHQRIPTLTKAACYLPGTGRYVPDQMIEDRIECSSVGRRHLRPSASGFHDLVNSCGNRRVE